MDIKERLEDSGLKFEDCTIISDTPENIQIKRRMFQPIAYFLEDKLFKIDEEKGSTLGMLQNLLCQQVMYFDQLKKLQLSWQRVWYTINVDNNIVGLLSHEKTYSGLGIYADHDNIIENAEQELERMARTLYAHTKPEPIEREKYLLYLERTFTQIYPIKVIRP